MYLLDTVTISEFKKAERRRSSLAFETWLKGAAREDFWLSVITIQELTTGYLRKRRTDPVQAANLQAWVDDMLRRFHERVLDVDLRVAQACAIMQVPKTLPYRDSLIAATASVYHLTVVTRNVKDFQNLGIKVLNPF